MNYIISLLVRFRISFVVSVGFLVPLNLIVEVFFSYPYEVSCLHMGV